MNNQGTNSSTIENSFSRRRQSRLNLNYLSVFLLLTNAVFLIALIFFYISALSPLEGLFDFRIIDISNMNNVRITPHTWNYYTWGIIYAWQALWILFGLGVHVKRDDYGELYKEAPVITNHLQLFLCSNFLLNIAWLFLWDSELFALSFGVTTLMSGNLLIAAIIAHANVYNVSRITSDNFKLNKNYVMLYRLLLNNGLSFYATWAIVETVINFSIAWTYEWDKNGTSETPTIVALSILTVLVLINFIIEISFFEKYMRYTFGNYFQLAIVLSAILSKNWNVKSGAAIFTLVLLEIVFVMFIVKLIITMYSWLSNKRKRALNYAENKTN